ncbi:ribosomal protein L22 [Trichodelitschia bisporula]|uniref:Ribosomal protein L22 n=1 Tax=Trichodelitschia bisporula TaxID=703511 RepID=A0A6G1I5Y8_9PEZI|nr:ribosomal protein L22 [Trichodelitschia bisporula]
MSLSVLRKRLAVPGRAAKWLVSPQPRRPVVHGPLITSRTFISKLFRSRHDDPPTPTENATPSNPLLEKYLKTKPKLTVRPDIQTGGVAPNSIFEEAEPSPATNEAPSVRNPNDMANVLDPDPRSRERFERKMVIREVRKRGRLTKAQQIKRTERENLSKSPMIKTSVKKLTKLANQIAGKPIEEAILQMQFSKKKAAKSVLQHLQYARDEAVVKRGMGLGKVENTAGEPMEIELKDGKRKVVTDRTSIYVDQAWVGRGMYGKAMEYRARGRANILHLPYTSISVVLKEEATRIRLSEEKQKKRETKKLWLPLPDRPIVQQRQFPMW